MINLHDSTHHLMRHTKLVCTIGPATQDRLPELIEAGMDLARINFSHGKSETWKATIDAVHEASAAVGRPVGVLVDLAGPKVRLGEFRSGEAELIPGETFVFEPNGEMGDKNGASTTHRHLSRDLKPGDHILLADGAAELEVIETGARTITQIVRGGLVLSHSGMSVPAERLSLPALTERDRRDLAMALEWQVDFIAQSFVRSSRDLRQLRELLRSSSAQIVAKIETRPAIENLSSIMEEADALMLARGDLGVQIPFHEVPLAQKRVIRQSATAGVPLIIATQMLESMIHAPRPTRAEATDAANAVFEGADALMMSAETAIGDYPIEAVRAAAAIAMSVEGSGEEFRIEPEARPPRSESEAMAWAAVDLAGSESGVKAIACFTLTGHSATLLSAARPRVPVFAFCPDPVVVRRLTVRRSVHAFLCDMPSSTDDMITTMDERLRENPLLPSGSLVVMERSGVADDPFTNFLKIHHLGN